jgi:hypothetical protein
MKGYILCCFGDLLYFELTKRLIQNIRKYDNHRNISILTDNLLLDSKY